ncbi:flagellar protein FliT [Sulfuriflexus mobilis]|uniref:flagellar protein FliT n=1 Tax=Sulfuriflexus mobilis TaxID=1811807 RepID=UPI000F8423F9|nr:flagellar protein FliT [Sulfuriflexus mobilis]
MADIVSLHSDWQALLSASERMLEFAHSEDWLSLAEEDLQRQALLKKYFAENGNNVSDILQTERIQHLQYIEKELLSLCTAGRDSTANNLHDIQRGKTADKAYLSNSI